MASIRNLKKTISVVRTAFMQDCELLYQMHEGDEKVQGAVEALNEEVQAQWDEIVDRMISYDRKAPRKEIRKHFDQIYLDAQRVANEAVDRLIALQGSEEGK